MSKILTIENFGQAASKIWRTCAEYELRLCSVKLCSNGAHISFSLPSLILTLPTRMLKSFLMFRNILLLATFVGNKAKGQISRRVFQENKARQIFQKVNICYPLIRTGTYVCVSGGKKYLFFEWFNVICILETPVLRFALLLYYGQILTRYCIYCCFTKMRSISSLDFIKLMENWMSQLITEAVVRRCSIEYLFWKVWQIHSKTYAMESFMYKVTCCQQFYLKKNSAA